MKLVALVVSILWSWSIFPVPMEAHTFTLNVRPVNMRSEDEAKLFEAVDLLQQVIGLEEFQMEILRHRTGRVRKFGFNRGFSNRSIYHIFLQGAEVLYPYRNNRMDVEVELYTDTTSKVIGFTYPNTPRIWMNTKYFDRYEPWEIAGNLMHEWAHKLGFEHERQKSEMRKFSVPYALGGIVKAMGKKIESMKRQRNRSDHLTDRPEWCCFL